MWNEREQNELVKEVEYLRVLGFDVEIEISNNNRSFQIYINDNFIYEGDDVVKASKLLSFVSYGFIKGRQSVPVIDKKDANEISEILYMYGDMYLEEFDDSDKEWDDFQKLESNFERYKEKLK